eukprot:8937574-Pyramimonas_sp.AAC.1
MLFVSDMSRCSAPNVVRAWSVRAAFKSFLQTALEIEWHVMSAAAVQGALELVRSLRVRRAAS